MPIEIIEEYTVARWLPPGANSHPPGVIETRWNHVTKDCGYSVAGGGMWPSVTFFVSSDGIDWRSSDLAEIDDAVSRGGREQHWVTRAGRRVRLRIRIGDGSGGEPAAVRIAMRVVRERGGPDCAPGSASC